MDLGDLCSKYVLPISNVPGTRKKNTTCIVQWFLKVQGIYASCLCLSTSPCYWGYRSQTGGRGETISAYKDNWLRITSVVSHSYQLQWHTPWSGWDWINGCTLHEVFPLPSGLVGEMKCMCRINSTSNSGLTLTLTNIHVCSNQAFYGTILTLCVMHSGVFYSISAES